MKLFHILFVVNIIVCVEAQTSLLEDQRWHEILDHALRSKPDIAQLFFSKLGKPVVGRRVSALLSQDNIVDYCGLCQSVAPVAKTVALLVPDYESIEDIVFTTCKQVIQAVAPTANADIICIVVNIQGPHVLTILKSFRSNTERICRNLNLCFDPVSESQTQSPVPEQLKENLESTLSNTRPEINKAVIRIAQLADIHVDPLYAIGSPSDCGLPVCCRNEYEGTDPAGMYGAYMCNTPQRTVELFMEKIKNLPHAPDFVVYTGDNPPHHAWSDTRELLLNCSDIIMASLSNIFKPNFTVYPALGNHEPHPTNLYYLPNLDVQELMAKLPGWWGPLAGMADEQIDTVKKAAYYTMMSPLPGLRIVTINSNFWYATNFYNILNEGTKEVVEMHEWIETTLKDARENKEKVILILHHPPGRDDFIHTYSRWYRSVVIEYRDIITLQMAGHTHHDEYRVFVDPSDNKAKGLLLVAPSVTAYSSSGGINPSMRIIHLDPDTYDLLDYEQYRMTFDGAPEIELVYRATEMFGLPDMTPTSFWTFTEKLRTDEEVFQKWYTQHTSGAPRKGSCTGECRKHEVCQQGTSSFDDYVICVRTINITKQKQEGEEEMVKITTYDTEAMIKNAEEINFDDQNLNTVHNDKGVHSVRNIRPLSVMLKEVAMKQRLNEEQNTTVN